MGRVVLFILVLFLVLLVLRALRFAAVALSSARRGTGASPAIEGEMVRDPVCGTWIDRRLALAGRRGEEWLPVCSEKCRKTLESP